MDERSLRDEKSRRSRYQFLDTIGARLDQFVCHWSDDGSSIERPLKTVFIGLLALVIGALTLQNIMSEYGNLLVPHKRVAAASQDLINQHKQQASSTLTQVAKTLASSPDFETAVQDRNLEEIARIADRSVQNFNDEIAPTELIIYAANQDVIYPAATSISETASEAPTARPDLKQSLLRHTNNLEVLDDGSLVVSAITPWVVNGRVLGYLKLNTNVENSLSFASNAVNGTMLVVNYRPSRQSTASGMNSPEPGYRHLSNPVMSDTAAAQIAQAAYGPNWVFPLHFDNNRLLLSQDLPIDILNGQGSSKLVLVRDVSNHAFSVSKSILITILVSAGCGLLAWLFLSRLLGALQSMILRTRQELEAEVRTRTKELERNRAQLVEAQAIASVGSWEGNQLTREIFGSDEFFRILGIPADTPPSDIIHRFFELVPEANRDKAKAVLKDALEHCRTFDFEHTIQRADGSTIRLHTQGRVIGDDTGQAVRVIGTLHDITERANAERRNTLMAKILETSLNEIIVCDAETFQIDYANAGALKNLGYSDDDLKQCKLWDICREFNQDTIAQQMASLASGKSPTLVAETFQRRKDGSEYPVDLHIQKVRDQSGYRYVAIANDITERVHRENETRDAKERAEKLAYFDPLTKLSNRAGCQRDARERFSAEEKPAFLIHVDMDNFKRVNDTLGHLAGDYCLAETGRRLREVSRGLGTPYRWGGDEFVILANTAESDPNELCERARRLMRAPMEYNGTTFWPTVSMGIAICPEHGTDFDTLLVNADLALYRSKHGGKDRFTFFSSDLQTLSDSEAQMERELHVAVQRDEFFLVFQPQVNMRTHKVVGVEALVRWRHPERGIVSPGDFLPVVEKTGFASVLGEIVIDKAFAAARSWQDSGLDFGRISVNISPSHLSSGSLLDQFKSAMKRHDLQPDRITAEVLESVFLDDKKSCHLETLTALHDMGVHVELDDFGTGYASLTHIVDLPINGLKIDRSFTQQLLEDDRKEIVVNQLIHLARSLNISVICEGVETEEQYDRLRMMGDFAIQGFLISRPVPFEQVTDWMAETAEDLYYVF